MTATLSEDRAAQLEEAVGKLRLRQVSSERVERWILLVGAVLIPIGIVVIVAGSGPGSSSRSSASYCSWASAPRSSCPG